MTGYLKREPFFALKYCRLLTETCAATDIGPTAALLCMTIALVEDAKRYSSPVAYHNGELLLLVGLKKWDALDRARATAIEAGWLHYDPPPAGSRRPGRYWATIPTVIESMDDSLIDEATTPENGYRQHPETGNDESDSIRLADTVGGTVTDTVGGNSLPIPKPSPSPSPNKTTPTKSAGPSKGRKLPFTDQDADTAQWMFVRIKTIVGAGAKEPNFNQWTDVIRLIRERDGKSDTDIRDLFTWANEHHFWKANVLSPDKLRSKWDQLQATKNTEHERKSNGRTRPTGAGHAHDGTQRVAKTLAE